MRTTARRKAAAGNRPPAALAIACLATAAIAWLAAASIALAAHPVDGAIYRGRIGNRGVSFRVSWTGTTMSWRGTATVGLLCPPYGAPGGPPAAVVVISRSEKQRQQGAADPPLVHIHPDGRFSGARHGLYFRGKFIADGRRLVLRIRIADRGCVPQRPEFTFRVS